MLNILSFFKGNIVEHSIKINLKPWHDQFLFCLLFSQHFPLVISDLQPYKYAGYPMLIRTITMETSDDFLFSKESPLLPAAVELAFHTVNCSALNAEELRRENGIEVIGNDLCSYLEASLGTLCDS